MLKTEAAKVIYILLQADGGCPDCTGRLISLFKGAFPEYANLAQEELDKENGG